MSNKIMQFFVTVLFLTCIVSLQARDVDQYSVYVSGVIKVPAGITNVVHFPEGLGYTSDGVKVGYRELDEVLFVNSTGTGTGTVTLSALDIGVATTIGTYSNIVPSANSGSKPRVTYIAESTASFLVSNNVVIPKTIITTKYTSPTFRDLKINIGQKASTVDNTYRYMIKAR